MAVTPKVAECKLLKEVTRRGDLPIAPTKGAAIEIYRAEGCEHCGFTGYRGRTGIYEMLPIDEALRVMIHDKVGEHVLDHYARERWPSIQQDGLRKVLLGETTLEEVLRVTNVDI